MLSNNNSLSVSPDEERGVHEVQVLVHVLLGRQVKQDVIGLCVQDVYVTRLRAQKGG